MTPPLYNLEILKLAASTSTLNRLENAQASIERRSPTCGSRVRIDLNLDPDGRVTALGAGEILLTSMDRDGTKLGYDLDLTRAIADGVSVPVIASGGVGELGHLVAGVRQGHASALLAASIFHFGQFSIAEAKAALAEAGIPVRLG